MIFLRPAFLISGRFDLLRIVCRDYCALVRNRPALKPRMNWSSVAPKFMRTHHRLPV